MAEESLLPTPMVPVFSLNLLPPFMAPNSGRAFLGFSVSELSLGHRHTWVKLEDTRSTRAAVALWPPHLDSSDGIWAGRVSSTSLRSLWASLRRSATCRWSLRRSTASMATSLRTDVMKASSESSEAEVEEPEGDGARGHMTRPPEGVVDASRPLTTHLVFQLRASAGSRPPPSPPTTAWPPGEPPQSEIAPRMNILQLWDFFFS